MSDRSVRARSWALFDEIVRRASEPAFSNPWHTASGGAELVFRPDYDTLRRLLGVPLLLQASSQSGVPALALDVWVAYELRRAGFDADAVWPRAEPPRVLPSTLVALRAAATVRQRKVLDEILGSGRTHDGETGASANLLGRNYVKQVDVVMSSWSTGPELMISTKRMDSSFGKNAANRVEESYGDAKNLRSRHPRSALGFVYGLRSTAFLDAPRTADWIVDLLGKLGQADDAYDAVALVVPDWPREASDGDDGDDRVDPLVVAGVAPDPDNDGALPAAVPRTELERQLDELPVVSLQPGVVPHELSPELFFATMVDRVLNNSPVTFHGQARQRRRDRQGRVGPV